MLFESVTQEAAARILVTCNIIDENPNTIDDTMLSIIRKTQAWSYPSRLTGTRSTVDVFMDQDHEKEILHYVRYMSDQIELFLVSQQVERVDHHDYHVPFNMSSLV